MTKNKKYEEDEEDFPEVKVKHSESVSVVSGLGSHLTRLLCLPRPRLPSSPYRR